MKNIVRKKATVTIVGVVIAAAAIAIIWNVFDVGTRLNLSGAIDDILAARNTGKARETLKEIASEEGRQVVIDALKDAVEEDTKLVQGKIELFDTLSAAFKEVRAARRMLDAKSKSSQRAAAFRYHGDKSLAPVIRPIVIEWIKDPEGDKRGLAAMVANRLKIEECVPEMMEAIRAVPETNEEIQFAQQALDALVEFKPDGLLKRVMEIAQDENQNSMLRGKAFRVAVRMDDVPLEELQALLLGILKNADGDNILRNMAAGVLRGEKFKNADVWAVLEEVLVREKDDAIIQRSCLYALGAHAPIENVKNLLLDRRVYRHPYFGIRADVATALAALHVQERIALEICCEYLEDTDEKDFDFLVPQEGFLSFWALTGVAHGVAEQRLFQRPPREIMGEQAKREHLFRWGRLRPGVNFQMIQAVQNLTTANLAEVGKSVEQGRTRPKKIRRLEDLKRVAQVLRGKIDQIMIDIEKRREAEAKAREEANKKKDQGPKLPPNDDEEKKDGSK